LNHQRQRLDEIAKELHINELDDWYKVSRAAVRAKLPFIKQYGSLFNALTTLYPNHSWNVFKFDYVPPRITHTMDSNTLKAHLQSQIDTYGISEYSDWLRLPKEELKLFHRLWRSSYTSAADMLTALFPHMNWRVQGTSKPEQSILVNFTEN
jgi:hypothetical protein